LVADAEAFDELAGLLRDFEVMLDEHPLALAKPWHQAGTWGDLDEVLEHFPGMPEDVAQEIAGQPRTSQKSLIQLLAMSTNILGSGGNRSGKTKSMLDATVAIGLGSDHPDARQFWANCELDPDVFPTGPANADHNDGEVWLIAKTSGASKEYHRTAIESRLAPGSYRWRNRDGSGPAELYVDCPGYDYPAMFRFKSEDQGRERMQGAKCRAILHDEEGPDREVRDECSTRLTDLKATPVIDADGKCVQPGNGWQLFANTPISGKTWVHTDLVEKTGDHAEPDCVVYKMYAIDNPYLSLEGLQKLAGGNAALRWAKLFGKYVARVGLVWPEFDSNVHVVQPFEIPPSWLRYRAIDFGTRNPFACLWGALSPDDRLYIYREHYRAGWTISKHVEVIRTAEGWVRNEAGLWTRGEDGVEAIEMSWADSESPQEIMQLNVDHDLGVAPVYKARDSVEHGIDLVSERLDPVQDGGPALFIFAGCVNTLREVPNYQWAPRSKSKDGPERPRKKDDHTCDDLRYMCMGIRLVG